MLKEMQFKYAIKRLRHSPAAVVAVAAGAPKLKLEVAVVAGWEAAAPKEPKPPPPPPAAAEEPVPKLNAIGDKAVKMRSTFRQLQPDQKAASIFFPLMFTTNRGLSLACSSNS